MNNSTSHDDFEKKIKAAAQAQAPLPNEEFVAGLRMQLAQQRLHKRSWMDRFKIELLKTRRGIALMGLGVVLLVAFMVGPQKALDSFQNLLDRIPDLGLLLPVDRQATSTDDPIATSQTEEYATFTPETMIPPEATLSPTSSPTPTMQDGVYFDLNRTMIFENTLSLSITIQWENTDWKTVDILDYWNSDPEEQSPHYLTLVDANGVQVPLFVDTTQSPGNESGQKASFVLTGYLPAQALLSPMTLTLNSLTVNATPSEEMAFQFTPTTDLQLGECEAFPQVLTLYGYSLEISEVCASAQSVLDRAGLTPPPQYGLEFHTVMAAGVRFFIEDRGCLLDSSNCSGGYGGGGGGGGGDNEQIGMTYGFIYAQKPAWPVEFVVTEINFRLPGPWSVQFDAEQAPFSTSSAQREAAHLAAETYPDGSLLSPGEEFVKTFTLENVGDTVWDEEYQLVFLEASPQGETMGSAESIPLSERVNPGEEIDISIALTAPQNGGVYTVVWGLVNGRGEAVNIDGGNIWVTIQVVEGGFSIPAIGVTVSLYAIEPGDTEP